MFDYGPVARRCHTVSKSLQCARRADGVTALAFGAGSKRSLRPMNLGPGAGDY
jgi:hypothetical protein